MNKEMENQIVLKNYFENLRYNCVSKKSGEKSAWQKAGAHWETGSIPGGGGVKESLRKEVSNIEFCDIFTFCIVKTSL